MCVRCTHGLEVRVFCVNLRIRTTGIVWNLGLTWIIPTFTYGSKSKKAENGSHMTYRMSLRPCLQASLSTAIYFMLCVNCRSCHNQKHSIIPSLFIFGPEVSPAKYQKTRAGNSSVVLTFDPTDVGWNQEWTSKIPTTGKSAEIDLGEPRWTGTWQCSIRGLFFSCPQVSLICHIQLMTVG